MLGIVAFPGNIPTGIQCIASADISSGHDFHSGNICYQTTRKVWMLVDRESLEKCPGLRTSEVNKAGKRVAVCRPCSLRKFSALDTFPLFGVAVCRPWLSEPTVPSVCVTGALVNTCTSSCFATILLQKRTRPGKDQDHCVAKGARASEQDNAVHQSSS